MRLLILQCVGGSSEPSVPFDDDLGVLAARLKQDGIDCRLAVLSGYRADLLRSAVEGWLPNAALVDMSPHAVTAAHRLIGELAGTFQLPVVVCGTYATCRPSQAVSIPGVRALLLGEYDRTGPALFAALRDGRDPAGLEGVWVNSSGGLVRGAVAALTENLDDLPFADRELFNLNGAAQAAREACFKTSRGCPMWCASCVNDWYMDLYADRGTFNRRRSVAHVLGEVEQVLPRYPKARRVAFLDHSFALNAAWLEEFAGEYSRRCPLPFRCFVPISAVNGELASRLARARCRWVETRIGSGSRFIRDEILSIRASNEQIVNACRTLRQAGLSVTAGATVGNPYESEITVDETIALLRRCEVDQVRAEVFYPTPGTRAAELCAESGWISTRGEECYWANRSVLDMPSLPAERIDALAAKLPALARRRGFLGKLLAKLSRPVAVAPRAKARPGARSRG